ncbi:hypothetical protein GWI33_013287, partial [Rhynchophorus ferrugineus]
TGTLMGKYGRDLYGKLITTEEQVWEPKNYEEICEERCECEDDEDDEE